MTTPVYLVEATDYERLRLWEDHHEEFGWEQGKGTHHTVDRFGERPVCVVCLEETLKGRPVVFWEAVSELVDYGSVKRWLNEQYPDVPQCNAMNFHLCLHALE